MWAMLAHVEGSAVRVKCSQRLLSCSCLMTGHNNAGLRRSYRGAIERYEKHGPRHIPLGNLDGHGQRASASIHSPTGGIIKDCSAQWVPALISLSQSLARSSAESCGWSRLLSFSDMGCAAADL